ncbi:MAG: benzoate/H(+) symporter BenE family transporter [Algicola sp.]|nr:benzoate/H(+) symporter BenE family transporter [Algicola sp.]
MLTKDLSFSAIIAGLVAVIVGYSSAIAIVYQAAQAAGATDAMMSSWILALGLGMGILGIGLSWYYRMPIVIAWSTPGAALLATSLVGQRLSDVIGAFVFVALLTIIVGVSGWFSKLMAKIPMSIAGAMLGGILLNFGVAAFGAAGSQPVLVGLMFFSFLIAKRLLPRYAVIVLLMVGIGGAYMLGLMQSDSVELTLAQPVWVAPTLDWSVIIGIGLPLFVVTMTGQNMPGVAVLKTSGFDAPVSSTITSCGIASLILSPFGGYTFNFASITAALCSSEDSHPNKQKRYVAGIACGVFNILVALAGGTIIALLASFPKEMVSCLAGLALLSAISSSISTAVSEVKYREAAMITFLVTISGVQFFGIASAFWGIVAGIISHLVLVYRPEHQAIGKLNKALGLRK